MKTYNLITVVNGTTSGIEPLVADSREKAIAFAAGMLSERVKGHETMFMSPGVRWGIDTGEVDLVNVSMLTGEVLGAFDLVQYGDERKLVWTPPM